MGRQRYFSLCASLALLAAALVAGCDARESTQPTAATGIVALAADAAAPTESWVVVRDPQAPRVPLEGADTADWGFVRGYEFSSDWLSKRLTYWIPLLEPYAGRADVRYLEIGVWEGRSFLWMIDRILTHPSSHATGIDIELRDVLRRNVEASGAADRVDLIEGPSQLEMRKLDPESYDVIYIDGAHMAADVLEDCVLAWRLLKPGGIMILDDYGWRGNNVTPSEPPPETLPRLAIDGFISSYRNYADVLLRKYQVALRKRPVVCPRDKRFCTTFGDYSYNWITRQLYGVQGTIETSDAERSVVETLIRAKRGDGLTLRVHRSVLEMDAFRSLNERLDLGITPVATER